MLAPKQDPLAGLQQNELPAGFTLEEVLFPNEPDRIECFTLLKAMSDELEKARTGLASEGRRAENKAVSDIWTKALKKSAVSDGGRYGGLCPQYFGFITRI